MKNEEGRSKGFGFVDFYEIDSAKNAIKKSGSSLDGREITIDFALPRKTNNYGDRP